MPHHTELIAALAVGLTLAFLGDLLSSLLLTVGKVAAFVVMMTAGCRFIPWVLARVARLGFRELFTLAVLGTPLGLGGR